jgi:pyruvate dehydrogenase E2 component (dihydrolipoamide acetyltransferase)
MRGGSLPTGVMFVRVSPGRLRVSRPSAHIGWQTGFGILSELNVRVVLGTRQGLMVPILKGSNRKTLREITDELLEVTNRARTNKLLLEDLHGATFAAANLEMNLIDAFMPRINLLQTSIPRVGRILPKPMAWRGRTRSLPGLSEIDFNHRVGYRASAARFLQRVKLLVEDPAWVLP